MRVDRNFDGISTHFANKIYGGLKGQIRLDVLWRDIDEHLGKFLTESRRVLDVGAGLAQIAIRLAQSGHCVHINDISKEMLALSQDAASKAEMRDKIRWHCCPFQNLPSDINEPFDLVMCHAVLEWLSDPVAAIPILESLVTDNGWLSLTFYNRNALIYRNLVRGNFNKVLKADYAGDPASLTPPNSLLVDQVRAWLQKSGFTVIEQSGIRVFNDYVRNPTGGNTVPEAIRDMELRFSRQEPFLWLGRYIHLLCKKS